MPNPREGSVESGGDFTNVHSGWQGGCRAWVGRRATWLARVGGGGRRARAHRHGGCLARHQLACVSRGPPYWSDIAFLDDYAAELGIVMSRPRPHGPEPEGFAAASTAPGRTSRRSRSPGGRTARVPWWCCGCAANVRAPLATRFGAGEIPDQRLLPVGVRGSGRRP